MLRVFNILFVLDLLYPVLSDELGLFLGIVSLELLVNLSGKVEVILFFLLGGLLQQVFFFVVLSVTGGALLVFLQFFRQLLLLLDFLLPPLSLLLFAKGLLLCFLGFFFLSFVLLLLVSGELLEDSLEYIVFKEPASFHFLHGSALAILRPVL